MKNIITTFLTFLSLTTLAFSQSIFDIFSKNIEFVMAWDLGAFEISFLILVIYALPSISIVFSLTFAYRIKKNLGKILEYIYALILAMAFFMQVFRQVGMLGHALIIFLSFGFAAFFSCFLYPKESIRKFFSYFSVATLIFPLLFIKALYAAGYFSQYEGNQFKAVASNQSIPVVLIIYDELALLTLLDSRGQIDKERFPSFWRFSEDSVWYLNAKTRAESTAVAVPSIISGTLKAEGTLPKYTSYPNNLFTLLNPTHYLNVIESEYTELCPTEFKCRKKIETKKRLSGFLYDTGLIYLHLTLPEEYSNKLTPISFKGHDFNSNPGNEYTDARIDYHKRFLSLIKNSEGDPALFFLHNPIPHIPWIYQPSGNRYATSWNVPGLEAKVEKWGPQEWLVTQAHQRHILQTIFVDGMLREILDSLKEKDMYERALIILTADHGVSFWQGQSRRKVLDNPELDIFGIPLFIKYPYGNQVGISYSQVSSLDILPTIADVLNIEIPFSVDGNSLLEKGDFIGEKGSRQLNAYISSASLQRKIKLFGEGDYRKVYKIGKNANLVGVRIRGDEGRSKLFGRLIIDIPEVYNSVDNKSGYIPSLISGRIVEGNKYGVLQLAVAVNDVICGVTETYPDGGGMLFYSIVPEDCFVSGHNDIKVYEISGNGKEISIAFQNKSDFGLFGRFNENEIMLSNGETLKKTKMSGNIDQFVYDQESGLLNIVGWSVNETKTKPNKYILYRINNDLNFGAVVSRSRPDVAKFFQVNGLTNSGFELYVSTKKLSGNHFEIIAVSEDGNFDVLSTSKFSEKMSNKELRMFGLYRDSHDDGSVDFLSRIFNKVFPENDAESIGSYGSQGIVLKDGKILVESEPFQGHVDIFSFEIKSDVINVAGWAANTDTGEPAEYVLYRVDDQVFYGSLVSLARPDVAKAYNKPSLEVTGFGFSIPSSLISEAGVVEVMPVMPDGKYKRISTDKFASTYLEIKR